MTGFNLKKAVLMVGVAMAVVQGQDVTPVDNAEMPLALRGTGTEQARELDVGLRIVGGDAAKEGQYPWAVSLQYKNKHFCGGSLIKANLVLTAAHCVRNLSRSKSYRAVVGRTDIRKSGGAVRGVKKVWIHPQFVGSKLYNDIAIVVLASPIRNIKPVDISSASSDASPGTGLAALGWGSVKQGSYVAEDVLRIVHIPAVSQEACTAVGSYDASDIRDTNICAGFKAGGFDSCQGDSGGPLVASKNGHFLHVGLVSWGIGCARPGKYGVYTRTSSYNEWIGSISRQHPVRKIRRKYRKRGLRADDENHDDAFDPSQVGAM